MKKLVFLLLALFLFGCTAQEQASRWGGDVKIDTAPSDICVVNGDPKILGLNIEQNDDVALIYVDKKGDVVALLYGGGLDGMGTDKTGTLYFEGDFCK